MDPLRTEAPAGRPEDAPRKPYTSPELTTLGSVETLTQTALPISSQPVP